MCFSPFAKQNQAEVWSQFQCLLKFLLWTKGDEWVKVLNALDPLCLWQCLEYTTHPKCGLRCGRVWWICGRVGNAKARGKMREIGALCSSDSVQSAACDIWTHYATQNRCTVLLIFGVVCGLDGPTVQLKISALCHNRHVFCAVSFAQSIGDVLTTLTLCNLWSTHREIRERNFIKTRKQTLL